MNDKKKIKKKKKNLYLLHQLAVEGVRWPGV